MTPKQLMIPRILAIGTEQGKQNYPDSAFKTGDILTKVNSKHLGECYRVADYSVFEPLDFPNCFRKLEWWEFRTQEQMPDYIRSGSYVFKVSKWFNSIGYKKDRFFAEIEDFIQVFDCKTVSPATEVEYLEYTKNDR